MPRCLPVLTSYVDRILRGVGFQLPPKSLEKYRPRFSGSTIFEKSALEVNIGFSSDFCANLLPRGINKSNPRGIKQIIDFQIDYFGHVGPLWSLSSADLPSMAPTWLPKGDPKATKMEHKTEQNRRQILTSEKKLFKTVLEPSWGDLGPILASSWGRFW